MFEKELIKEEMRSRRVLSHHRFVANIESSRRLDVFFLFLLFRSAFLVIVHPSLFLSLTFAFLFFRQKFLQPVVEDFLNFVQFTAVVFGFRLNGFSVQLQEITMQPPARGEIS